MAHHAEEVVVEQDDLHVQPLLHDGAEFLDRHLQSAVADEEADGAIRCAELGADGGRQAEAHRAQSAGGDDAARLGVLEVAYAYHLVLSHVGHEHRVMVRGFGDAPHHFAHVQLPVGGVYLFFDHFFPLLGLVRGERLDPRRVACRAYGVGEGAEGGLGVA